MVSARETHLLNWQGQFYGCGLTVDEVFYLNSLFEVGGVDNSPGNCDHSSDDNENSNYYCDINAREWKDATVNYDGSDFDNGVYIDASKSTNGEFINAIKNGNFDVNINNWNLFNRLDKAGWDGDVNIGNTGGSLRLDYDPSETNPGMAKQCIPFKNSDQDVSYTVKANFYCDGGSARFYFSQWRGGEGHINSQPGTSSCTGSWEEYITTLLIPAYTELLAGDNLCFYVYADSLTTGSVYYDNIQITPSSLDSSGCCPSSYCWDGSVCVGGVRTTGPQEPYATNEDETEGYYCILTGDTADWESYDKKSKFDDIDDIGYCPVDKCWSGSRCVAAGTYFDDDGTMNQGDNYCEPIYDESNNLIDTKWTSRTKRIALQMLKFAYHNGATDRLPFTLSCDTADNALNKKDNSLNTETNNYCVLKYGSNDGVLVGTSINGDANVGTVAGNLKTGATCSTVRTGSEIYGVCQDSDNKLWFDSYSNTIIYGANLNGNIITNAWTAFVNFLKGLFGATTPPTDISAVKFQKLYIYRGNNKMINATMGSDYMFVEYDNFDSDMCFILDNYDHNLPCVKNANKYTVNIGTSDYDSYKDLWQDLTSKLRIK